MTSSSAEFFPWRSILFVPANMRRFVEKAPGCGSDAIVLDLEDSVAHGQKEAARAALREAVSICAKAGPVLVRINRPLDMAVRDIEAAISPGVAGLLLPKTESAGHLQLLAELVASLELKAGITEGSTRFIPVIETPTGLRNIYEIAAAHRRNIALGCGSEDFALSIGAEADADVLLNVKQLTVYAARAAGIAPMGIVGTIADYRDLDTYRRVVRNSVRFGFEGSTCVHPSNVPILNAEFAPGRAETAHAERLIAAYDRAVAEGRGAVEFEGKMIDWPIVVRARQVLARGRHFGTARD